MAFQKWGSTTGFNLLVLKELAAIAGTVQKGEVDDEKWTVRTGKTNLKCFWAWRGNEIREIDISQNEVEWVGQVWDLPWRARIEGKRIDGLMKGYYFQYRVWKCSDNRFFWSCRAKSYSSEWNEAPPWEYNSMLLTPRVSWPWPLLSAEMWWGGRGCFFSEFRFTLPGYWFMTNNRVVKTMPCLTVGSLGSILLSEILELSSPSLLLPQLQLSSKVSFQ